MTAVLNCFQGLEVSVKLNPALQKGMKERGIKKINDYPETRWGYIYMCAKDILEKWDKLCEMKEDIRRVVRSDFFSRTNKGHTDHSQVSLGATLLCLGIPSK